MIATVPNDAALASAIGWMTRLAGAAAAINALELWALRADASAHGIWRPGTLRAAWGALSPLLAPTGFRVVLLAQLAAALVMMAGTDAAFGHSALPVATAIALLGTLLAAMRFRGTVNGGSDGMLFTVLAGLLIAHATTGGSRWQQAGVLYVAAQVTVSYLRAGLVKITRRSWWTGEALTAFLRLPAYGVPAPVVVWAAAHPRVVRMASMTVMGFECLAPLAWRSPSWCLRVLTAAVTFHMAVALLFRLNRFLWGWGAALPSLWYAVHRLP